jgi:hypothetical protein
MAQGSRITELSIINPRDPGPRHLSNSKHIGNFMKKIRKIGAILPGITLALALLLPVSAQAATLTEVVDSVNRLRVDLIAWLNAAHKDYLTHLYEDNPNYPTTVVVNTNAPAITPVIDKKTSALALADIKEILEHADAGKMTRRLASAPASDTYQPTPTGQQPASVAGRNKRADLSEGDRYLYIGTLISPLAYQLEPKKDSKGEQAPTDPSAVTAKSALGYIQFLLNQSRPTALDMSKLTEEQRKLIAVKDLGKEYTVLIRSLLATRSVGADNLLTIYTRRLPIEGLGEKVGMPGKKDASAAEVENYLATRRADSPEWYKSIAKASGATIARETLFVLVEIQRQLYDLKQDNERIVATLSVMQLSELANQMARLDAKKMELKQELGISDGSGGGMEVPDINNMEGALGGT